MYLVYLNRQSRAAAGFAEGCEQDLIGWIAEQTALGNSVRLTVDETLDTITRLVIER